MQLLELRSRLKEAKVEKDNIEDIVKARYENIIKEKLRQHQIELDKKLRYAFINQVSPLQNQSDVMNIRSPDQFTIQPYS